VGNQVKNQKEMQRMKKVKALVVILTVALMAMGIGYAAWSDQINMTATAKTGHLDVTWIDAKVHSGKTYGDLSANTDFKQKFAFTKGEVNGYEYDNVGIYNNPYILLINGAPGRTRTPGTRFRKPLLCPAELRAPKSRIIFSHMARPAGIEPTAF
jgi:hypothetical protein